MPVRGNPDPLYLGRAYASAGDDLRVTLQRSSKEKFDFVVIPLAAPGGQGRGAAFQPSVESDLVLSGQAWNDRVVGAVSEGLVHTGTAAEAAASSGAAAPRAAEEGLASLETELRWAAHLGLHGVLLPPPTPIEACCSYARTISELLLAGNLDAGAPEATPLAVRVLANGEGWQAWNRFRTLCDHHARLSVALELTARLPKMELELSRWFAEPVQFLLVPTTVFLENNRGYPVLRKWHKALVLSLFAHKTQVILMAPGGAADTDISLHMNYIARLFQSRPPPTEAEKFMASHVDTLQAPLQPLQDNLETGTYELFEKDPVKYVQYEEAVLLFLKDRIAAGRPPPFTIMVVGAGRGPLVAASLRAARRADVAVAVWAVEKNPNAVHSLRHKRRTEEGWHCVEVIAQDMRTWEAPRKADVMVSELLGSFSDNELSPECLDGAQRFLAEDGVCIPQSYVSALAPVSSPKVWDDVRNYNSLEHFEMGYVVQLSHSFRPASSVQDCFTFQHPNWALESNDRYVEIAFDAEVDALVHGFIGYFDCILYREVHISIHPKNASSGMRHDAKKVWYEWAISEPSASPIHNPGGRSWAVGL